jgi:uncharacterized protein YdcH (DUF465 family)
MPQKARDRNIVKCAAKLYYDGMSYHEISRSLNLSYSTVQKWHTRPEWIEEINRLREEDTKFIERSPASYTKLKEQLKQTEGNAKTYNVAVKKLQVRLLALMDQHDLDSTGYRDIRTIVQSLKDLDELFRQNLNFTFSLDDVTKRLEDLTEQ